MSRFGRRRDRTAFEELVRRWDRRVLSFLAKSSGDLDAAEDLRQEVFLRVYRYGAGYDPQYAFAGWLFKIAANVLKTWQGKRARRRETSIHREDSSDAIDPVDQSPDPRQRAVGSQSAERVQVLMKGLQVEDRELLLYRFDLGLSYREIATIKGTPETTIKSRLYKLLATMRRDLKRAELTGKVR